jgi:hypothetical protein
MTHRVSVSLTLAALLALILLSVSCGGNSAQFAGDADTQFEGITQGDFKAVRYNGTGDRDSALNETLALQTQTVGDTTTVKIAISDSTATSGVTMDLVYDAGRYTPDQVKFDGLIESPIQLYITKVSGVVALGQVSVEGSQVHGGAFATVTFRHEANRTVSAAGDAHDTPINTSYGTGFLTTTIPGFEVNETNFQDADPITYTIRSIFATGDGDQNGETNIADLTPIGVSFQAVVSDTDLSPARADYDANGEVNIADLTPIGQNFGEVTSSIEVALSDSADSSSPTVIDTHTWISGTPSAPPGTTTDPADVWRTWTGDVSSAEADSADTNNDGIVFITARAVSDTGADGDYFPGISLSVGPGLPDGFEITDFSFGITGATGGSGTNGAFESGDTAVVEANSTITFDVTEISGLYEGTPFTSADRGGSVPEAEYDAALAAFAATVDWSVASAGAGGFVDSGPVLNPATGASTGATAVVFPDWDPESTPATTTEGILTITTDDGSFTVDLDVVVDPNAAEITDISSSEGDDGTGNPELSLVTSTELAVFFDWGSAGVPGTIDGTTVDLQLFNVENDTVAQDYTFAAGPDLAADEFTVRDNGGGNYSIEVNISPSVIVGGGTYALRIFTDGVFSSVNLPGEFLVTAPMPVAVELETLPREGFLDDDDSFLTIMWPDPIIRRNPDVQIQLDESVDPKFPAGFADLLKQSGNEFPVNAQDGAANAYPQVTIVATNDPNNITAATVGELGPIVVEQDPDRIVVNIDALPPPPQFGSTTYSFKLFGPPTIAGDPASRFTIGFGTFTVSETALQPTVIIPVDFGVNIFDGTDRGDLGLEARDYTDKSFDTASIVDFGAAGTPDALFVEWNGGRVGDYTEAGGEFDETLDLILRRIIDDQTYTVPHFDIRVAGVGTGDLNYIGMHAFETNDLQSAGVFGNIVQGESFAVQLKDATQPNAVEFDTTLIGVLFAD